MIRRLIFTLLPLLPLLFGGCADRFGYIRKRDRLVVAVEPRMPGLVHFGSDACGYQKKMLRLYADRIGVDTIEFVRCEPDNLWHGESDMAIYTLSGEETDGEVIFFTSSYVVLTHKATAENATALGLPLSEVLRGGNILVSGSFFSTEACHDLLDSLRGANIFISEEGAFSLLEELSSHKYDFLICEKSEAIVGCAITAGNIEQIYDFGEPVPFYIRVNPALPAVGKDFAVWLDEYRNSSAYISLNDMLSGRDDKQQGIGDISCFDELFRRIAEREGHDWRLLAAIAFVESRFNVFAVSPRGAKGLMQVMPATARHNDVEEEDIMNPELNVTAAARLLNDIRKSLNFAPETSQEERMRIILACYNAGLGRILAARDMVVGKGGNPDLWEEVARYLINKGEAPDADKEDNDTMPEGETTAFVSKVMYNYMVYRMKTEL